MNKKIPEKLKPSEFELKWRSEWAKHRVYQPDMKSANPSTKLRARPPF